MHFLIVFSQACNKRNGTRGLKSDVTERLHGVGASLRAEDLSCTSQSLHGKQVDVPPLSSLSCSASSSLHTHLSIQCIHDCSFVYSIRPYYSLRNTIKDDTGYEVFLSLTGTVMK